MFKRLIILLIAFLPFLSCCTRENDRKENKTVPQDIVSPDEMKNILEDIFIAECASGVMETKHVNIAYFSKHYYSTILKKKNITISQFNNSYRYYIAEPAEMEKILTAMIEDLSKKQSEVKNE